MIDKDKLIFDREGIIDIVDQFTFRCIQCNTEFNIYDVERRCNRCNTELFPKMKRKHFRHIFKETLKKLNVDNDLIDKFFANKDIKVSELNICNKLSTIIDMNMEIQFGGQYKSFEVCDNYETIINNNFYGGD